MIPIACVLMLAMTGSPAPSAAARPAGPGILWIVPAGLAVVLCGVVLYAFLHAGNKRTLRDLMQSRACGYPPACVLFMLYPVMNALHACHRTGNVHGGIHPGVLFVDRQQRLVLRKRKRRGAPDARAYLPMEQYASDAVSRMDGDVYALGAVMFLLLTGKAPDAMHLRMQQDTVPAILDGVEGLFDPMKAALLRALAFRREDRFGDVADFMEALGCGAPVARTEEG